MGFKDNYRAWKSTIEAQRNLRVPFKWESKAKKIGLKIIWPFATALGGIICLGEWLWKKRKNL